jgi:hypothetical protein
MGIPGSRSLAIVLLLANYTAGIGLGASAATPTPSTAGVSSERGIVSFVVFLVLIAVAVWYFRRRWRN